MPADTQMTTFNPFLALLRRRARRPRRASTRRSRCSTTKGKPVPYLRRLLDDQRRPAHLDVQDPRGTEVERRRAADGQGRRVDVQPDHDRRRGRDVQRFAGLELQVRRGPGRHTLVITTKEPQANMLYVSVPVSGIPIVPQHVWEQHVSDLKDYQNMDFPVVGYGPWRADRLQDQPVRDPRGQQGLLHGCPWLRPARSRTTTPTVTRPPRR